MGTTVKETIIPFPGEDIYVLHDEGSKEEYGYEVHLYSLDKATNDMQDIKSWSFGYEEWSKDVWNDFGNALAKGLQTMEGNSKSFDFNLSLLESIRCMYTPGKDNHLRDLDQIKEIIELCR